MRAGDGVRREGRGVRQRPINRQRGSGSVAVTLVVISVLPVLVTPSTSIDAVSESMGVPVLLKTAKLAVRGAKPAGT